MGTNFIQTMNSPLTIVHECTWWWWWWCTLAHMVMLSLFGHHHHHHHEFGPRHHQQQETRKKIQLVWNIIFNTDTIIIILGSIFSFSLFSDDKNTHLTPATHTFNREEESIFCWLKKIILCALSSKPPTL